MKLWTHPRSAVAALAVSGLLLTACSVDKPDANAAGDDDSASTSGSGGTASAVQITGPDSVPEAPEDEELSVAFFGFARANSFAAATFAGIEEYAGEHNATAEFLDPNFDAQKQASQIQDAVTSGRYDVFIVQANDGTAVMPAIEQALAQDITVVIEFTPVGTQYDTAEPQVDGTITLVDVPTENGTTLGELGVEACEEAGVDPCQVAYLEGFKSLPLDNARTDAVKEVLEGADGVELVASVEGGYTRDSGRTAMQDILQSHPDVNVVIGSSQAVAGAAGVAGDREIAFIGNGGSRQAVDAVRAGDWFGTVCLPERTAGATAAALGLAAARGVDVPDTNTSAALSPVEGRCTQDTVGDIQGEYDE
ncbi:sugar ABC transporter substrate-binding protein [Ornithinimicrobium cavernae]|uniref:sugar ABC transporter substrate-binding protein n=1 Tax=Ornithinimicrobium cavernae TaxID=2666047 RepID=UPI000D69E404|nr:sugar ABC transporter substrate-binding protein [Ornithinimicrobium cavernae]